MKESLFKIGIGIAATAAIVELSRYAFIDRTRKEILKRDNNTCVGLYGTPCYFEELYGEPASRSYGYFLTAAHFPEYHGGHNDDSNYGRCLCLACHATEELLRSNVWGAKKLLENGVMNISDVTRYGYTQFHLTTDDLQDFVDSRRLKYNEYLFGAGV